MQLVHVLHNYVEVSIFAMLKLELSNCAVLLVVKTPPLQVGGLHYALV